MNELFCAKYLTDKGNALKGYFRNKKNKQKQTNKKTVKA